MYGFTFHWKSTTYHITEAENTIYGYILAEFVPTLRPNLYLCVCVSALCCEHSQSAQPLVQCITD